MALPDLITQPYLLAALGAGWATLSAPVQAVLPQLTTAASRAVRARCNRAFTRRTADELYTVGPRESIVLREYPVNGVVSVSSGPTAVLTVANAAPGASRALVGLAASGDLDSGLTAAGVALTWWTGGTRSSAVVPLAPSMSLGDLAAAVESFGQGWTASAPAAYAGRAAADLRPPQGNYPAVGAGASLRLHVDDLAYELDAEAGVVVLDTADDADPFSSPRWGPWFMSDWGDQQVRGVPGGVRVVYDVGFDAIPEAVQQYTVEAVQAILSRLRTDPSLVAEKGDGYEWAGRGSVPDLPEAVSRGLGAWRNVRA